MLPLFEVGDRVTVVEESNLYFGGTGIVRKVFPIKAHIELECSRVWGHPSIIVIPLTHIDLVNGTDGTNPRISLALIGDDRRAPDGDAWETKMLRKLCNTK